MKFKKEARPKAYLDAWASGNGALYLCFKTRDGQRLDRPVTPADARRYLKTKKASHLAGWHVMRVDGLVVLVYPIKRLSENTLLMGAGTANEYQITYEIDQGHTIIQRTGIIPLAAIKALIDLPDLPDIGRVPLRSQNALGSLCFFLNKEEQIKASLEASREALK